MEKKKIGISIYPDKAKLQDTKSYLDLAKKYNYEIVFVSFIHLKKDDKETLNTVIEAIKYAKSLGFYILADVHFPSLEMLGVPINDFRKLKEMGVDCVRFDSPAMASDLAALTHNDYELDIQLNMSNNDSLIDNVMDFKPVLTRLHGGHNFYPQKNTAINWDFFVEATKRYTSKNLSTLAFIGSHNGNQGPAAINKELPTLEFCRDLPVDSQAKVLFYSNTINNVLFGNAFATEEELKKVSELDREEITFNLEWDKSITKEEQEIANYKEHFRRGDVTEYFIRSTMSRVIWAKADIKPRDKKSTYNKGDVVIVNNNGASYKGELHIILKDGYTDEINQYNQIGKVSKGDLFLMNFVEPWSRFRLK